MKNTGVLRELKSQMFRFWVQTGFIVLCVWIGVQFVLWHSFHETGSGLAMSRPPGVEGFLPISALMSLWYWILSGDLQMVHPAGTFILIAIVAISIVFKKSFCSWLCPIGTISENIAELGKKLFGRNFVPWRWLDYLLRSIKYLLLAFLVYTVFVMMDVDSLRAFLDSPYNRVADVKMMLFFKDLSRVALIVIGVLVLFSVIIKNFWCRYLCPYGALLAITGLLSPFRIIRNTESCIDCTKCAKVCPSAIRVDRVRSVWSDECTSCMACVEACPVSETLQVKAYRKQRKPVSPVLVGVVTAAVFMLITGLAMLTGHWQNNVTEQEYSRRIKDINNPVYQHNQGSAPSEPRTSVSKSTSPDALVDRD